MEAISRSQGIIEFTPDGIILTANDNFLQLVGYRLDEVVGKHHSLFMDEASIRTPAYEAFWSDLKGGRFNAGEYMRIGQGGKRVWIRASYNPVLDRGGRTIKVVKFAADVTRERLASAEAQAEIDAISRSQAVIEFTLQGEVITANENFCRAFGYSIDEVRGRPHRLFVKPDYAASPEYVAFWERLRRGEFQTAEYLRLGKGGREVGISATYNPIFDIDGKPYKIIKFATVITDRKVAERVIQLLKTSLERMAGGDLTGSIDQAFTGEYEELRQAFNHSLLRFSAVISGLRATSSALRAAMGEILAGANDLSERTTKQAAAIEKASASMEAVSGTIGENAARAELASNKAGDMARSATQGGEVMSSANQAMQRITQSSAKISNIIGLIDDIAFQTNLLALNASVEAARAGEAGKGFAVVAVEVRRLAQSAAQASAEVKVLIEESAREVSGGSRLVSDAGAQLGTILDGITQNAGLMAEIAQASRSQAQSIGEISQAVRQMDEMTQHNAALVEETNAAIEQTEGHVGALDKTVASFTTAPQQGEASSERPRLSRRAA